MTKIVSKWDLVINGLSDKASPVGADIVCAEDSASSWAKVKMTLANIFKYGLNWDITPGSDHDGEAITANWQVDSNSVGIGAVLYIASDGNLEEADADDVDKVYGLCLAMEAGTGSKKIMKKGIFRDDTWNWTPGKPIFLSTTAGNMTQTVPVTSPAFQEPIATAISADVIWFDPPQIARTKYYSESEGESSTSSTSWQDKLSVTVPAGTYDIEWSCSTYATFNFGINFSRVRLYNDSDSTEIHRGGADAQMETYYTQGGMQNNVVIAGSKTFKIQYISSGTPSTAYIRWARLKLTKIG